LSFGAKEVNAKGKATARKMMTLLFILEKMPAQLRGNLITGTAHRTRKGERSGGD
jgi:hypothetical protein